MKIPRRYIRTATVLTIAAATGHVMQNADAIAARLGIGGEDQIVATPAATAKDMPGPLTHLAALPTPRIDETPGLSFIPGVADMRPDFPRPVHLPLPGQHQVAALDTAPDTLLPVPRTRVDAVPVPPVAAAGCAPELVAQPEAAAMVRLSLTAPCNPNAEARIAHAGIAFKIMTDADGAFSLQVPALESSAQFTVTLPGQADVSAGIEVPTLAAYDRVAVTWAGPAGLELHAFEFGADYDQAGHVWRGNPKSTDLAIAGRGGFSTLLGDAAAVAPVMAEIYTFPAGRSTRSGLVRLSLEAEVTAETCGHDIAGHSVTVMGGETPSPVDITLAVPDCDAIGDFLVLNNLFDDLKIAAK